MIKSAPLGGIEFAFKPGVAYLDVIALRQLAKPFTLAEVDRLSMDIRNAWMPWDAAKSDELMLVPEMRNMVGWAAASTATAKPNVIMRFLHTPRLTDLEALYVLQELNGADLTPAFAGALVGISSINKTSFDSDSDALPIGATTPWDPLESTCRHASLSIL